MSIKVLPVAPAQATLVFQVEQAQALAQLHRWGGQPLPLNASCWWQDDAGAGWLRVRLRGAAAAVRAAIGQMTQDLPGQELPADQAERDWAALRDWQAPLFAAALPGGVLWRLSVPQTAPVLDLPWPQWVEWQGGQRWLWAPPEAQGRLRETTGQVGGSASIVRAPGAEGLGVGSRFHPMNPATLAVHRRLKAEFDPVGILNPGRMYPGL